MWQLIASIVLMYLVVGTGGWWALRKRAEQQTERTLSP